MVKVINPKINESIYKNAVLYFIKYCNNQYLHPTKLNKLLYYLDFIHFRDNKTSVTGDVYMHQGYGPVPSRISDILALLKKEGAIDTKVVSYKNGELTEFELKNPKILKEEVFSQYQKKLLKQICDEFTNWPTDKIVAQTHLEAPWFYSRPYDVVDFTYAHDIDFFR